MPKTQFCGYICGNMTTYQQILIILDNFETHYSRKGRLNLPDFEIFEAIRKGKEKGGTMIGVHKALKPFLITERNDPFELIVVEITIGQREIRVMSGYGPQESWSPELREPFFQALEEEVIKAELAGKSLIIEADFNSKLGREFVPNDPHVQDKNGRLLADIIRRQNLCVANGLMACEGTITRKRITTLRTEESVISHVLVSEDLKQHIMAVHIDEKRQHVLTRISKTKTGSEHKESDHNIIETTFKFPWNNKEIPKLETMFNLKNERCRNQFRKETTNNNKLSKVFEEEKDLDVATEKFMKKLNKLLHKCFQKITVKKQRESRKEEKLYEKWKHLKNKDDPKSKAEMEEIEAELSEEYFNKVKIASKEVDCAEGGNISAEIWKLKKEFCPRRPDQSASLYLDCSIFTRSVAAHRGQTRLPPCPWTAASSPGLSLLIEA